MCENIKEPTITTSKTYYNKLVDDSHFLECLMAQGVDNWSGYDDACEMYRLESKIGEDE